MVKRKQLTKKAKRSLKKKNSQNVELVRAIPKQKLEAAFELMKQPNAKIWKEDNGCLSNVHSVDQIGGYSSVATYLRYARIFLLRRDMASLGKLLTLAKPTGPRSNMCLYPIFVKYGAICLANSNQKLLRSLCNSLLDSNDTKRMMKVCTTYREAMDESV